eukprot:gene51177-28010_t
MGRKQVRPAAAAGAGVLGMGVCPTPSAGPTPLATPLPTPPAWGGALCPSRKGGKGATAGLGTQVFTFDGAMGRWVRAGTDYVTPGPHKVAA